MNNNTRIFAVLTIDRQNIHLTRTMQKKKTKMSIQFHCDKNNGVSTWNL